MEIIYANNSKRSQYLLDLLTNNKTKVSMNKELKIYLTDTDIKLHDLGANLLHQCNKLQELFGGNSLRKTNFFGYFLRVGSEAGNIFIYTNHFKSKRSLLKALYVEINNLATKKE